MEPFESLFFHRLWLFAYFIHRIVASFDNMKLVDTQLIKCSQSDVPTASILLHDAGCLIVLKATS